MALPRYQQPQPDYSATYALHPEEHFTVEELEALAHSLTHAKNTQFCSPEMDPNALDLWKQHPDGGEFQQTEGFDQVLGHHDHLSNSNPNINAWAAIEYQPQTSSTMHHHHHEEQPPYTAVPSSSIASPPQPGFVPLYTSASAGHYQSTDLAYQPYASSSSGPTSPQTLEEHELRRLRNTAASARFRAKKKAREASLERSTRSQKEKLQSLEDRIKELEEENKFLKNLIMEKKDVKEEVARLRAKYGAVREEMKEFEHKDGVGTSKK